MISHTIFGRYDIRGRIPTDFTVNDGYTIARAIFTYYQQQVPGLSAIVLGRDGRATSEALAAQVHAAAHDAGITVHDIGLCPSPQLYHALYTGPVSSGIMITASHNGAEYNGFKLRLERQPVWGEALEEIAKKAARYARQTPGSRVLPPDSVRMAPQDDKRLNNRFANKISHTPTKTSSWAVEHQVRDVIRDLEQYPNPLSPYVTDLANRFSHLASTPLHAIIDASGGAAGPVISQLLTALNLKNITAINTTPDPAFTAHPPDPSKKENLTELIGMVTAAPQPTIGLALDGDGDRLTVILEDGTHLSGDDTLALLAQPVLKQHPGMQVVGDIKSSSRLTRTVTAAGGTCHFAPCGHPYVQAAMKQHGALLGGEVSGHLFFNDEYFGFDDGVYAMLRVLALRQQAGVTLQSLFAQLPVAYATPEQRIACKNKHEVVAAFIKKAKGWPHATLTTIDGVRVELPEGWLLVRAAQTEPALSVRCEGVSEAALATISALLEDA